MGLSISKIQESKLQYTEDQKADFKEQFKRRRRNQIILAVPLLGAILLVAALRGRRFEALLGLPTSLLGPAFLAFAVAGVGFSLYNWRCPACNKYLGRDLSPRFCNKCGVPLQ